VTDPGRPRSATFRLVLLGVLVVALLASAGILVWLLADRRGESDDLQSEREAVMSQTEQFVLRLR
jgi:Mce-associated membrane protein